MIAFPSCWPRSVKIEVTFCTFSGTLLSLQPVSSPSSQDYFLPQKVSPWPIFFARPHPVTQTAILLILRFPPCTQPANSPALSEKSKI